MVSSTNAVGLLLILSAMAEYQENGVHHVCNTTACGETADFLRSIMDTTVDPCHNFYAYACGSYGRGGEGRDTFFADLSRTMWQRLVSLLAGPAGEQEPSVFKKAKKLYRSCTANINGSEQAEWDPVVKLVAADLGWPVINDVNSDVAYSDWIATSYKLMELGIYGDYLFRIEVVPDDKKIRYILQIDAPLVGYEEPQGDDKFNEFSQFVVTALLLNRNSTQFRYSEIVQLAKDVLDFRRQLAGAQGATTETVEGEAASGGFEGADTTPLPDGNQVGGDQASTRRAPVTLKATAVGIATLQRQHDFVPWLEYLRHWLPSGTNITDTDVVHVRDPGALHERGRIINSTQPRTVVNYLVWQALRKHVLPIANNDTRTTLDVWNNTDVILGARSTDGVKKLCADFVYNRMPAATLALYTQECVSETSEQLVQELFHQDVQEMVELLEAATWLSNTTREAARRKLREIKFNAYRYRLLAKNSTIGLLDTYYEQLNVSADDLLSLTRSLSAIERRMQGERLFKDVKDYEWMTDIEDLSTAVTLVNAYYAPLKGLLLLGPIFYDSFRPGRPHFLSYGSVGYIIGHEISHGVDPSMSVFPPDLDWVNNAGKMEFSERVQCIIQQFENMSMEGVDLKVDGEETVEENTADTVGVRLAYRAYIRRTQLYGEEPGLQLSSSTGPTKALSARQLFWVSFASSFCAKNKSSEELLTDYNKDPVHAPAAFRVVGTVMNQHEFAADFGCPAGSPMNPVHKCRVW